MADFITVLALVTGGLSLVLYFLELRDRKVLERKLASMNFTPSEAEKKSSGLVHNAIKKAQSIVGQAETESIKVIATSKFEMTELEKKYEEELEATGKKLEESLKKIVEERIDKETTGFGGRLTDVLAQEREGFRKAYGDELAKVRESYEKVTQELDSYKKQQFQRVDSEIVTVVSKTLKNVLADKARVDLNGQTELVMKALEKAKEENFI